MKNSTKFHERWYHKSTLNWYTKIFFFLIFTRGITIHCACAFDVRITFSNRTIGVYDVINNRQTRATDWLIWPKRMADDSRIDYRTSVCDEILLRIISFSDARSILRLSQTCRRFYRICLFDQLRWRRLCLDDFTINLASSAPFPSFRHLYKLLYQSREILKFYLSDSFPISGNYRYGGISQNV